MYVDELDGMEPDAPRLPYRTLAVARRLLLRALELLQTAGRAVRTFGPLAAARSALAGPLYRLRTALAWVRGRNGLRTSLVLGVAGLALSDPGLKAMRAVRARLAKVAAGMRDWVGRQLAVHCPPAVVVTVALRVLEVAAAAVAPLRKVWLRARRLVSCTRMTAQVGSLGLGLTGAVKLAVPAVPTILVLLPVLAVMTLLSGLRSEPTPPTDGGQDAGVAYAAMLQLSELLPQVRTAVSDAVKAGDKDELREARRLLAGCRSRTGELRKAAQILRAEKTVLPADLAKVLDDLDLLVEEMSGQWAQLGGQLRDATGNRADRRAAASKARRQWSPTAATS